MNEIAQWAAAELTVSGRLPESQVEPAQDAGRIIEVLELAAEGL